MKEVANFIGELGGESWTTQAVALVCAAVLALTAAVVTALVTAWQGRLNRLQTARINAQSARHELRLKSRENWWDRFSWASEQLTSAEDKTQEIAAMVLERLEDVDWITEADRKLIDTVLKKKNSGISESDVEEALREQNNEG